MRCGFPAIPTFSALIEPVKANVIHIITILTPRKRKSRASRLSLPAKGRSRILR